MQTPRFCQAMMCHTRETTILYKASSMVAERVEEHTLLGNDIGKSLRSVDFNRNEQGMEEDDMTICYLKTTGIQLKALTET